MGMSWGGEDQGPHHMGRTGEVMALDFCLSMVFTLLSWESYCNLPPNYISSKGQGEACARMERPEGFILAKITRDLV